MSLKAAQISFFSDPARRSPAELLEVWPSLVDVGSAARHAGVHVSVVQASTHSDCLERNGVRFHFLPFGNALREVRQSAGFGSLLRQLAPDVLHVHGLEFLKDVRLLAALVPGIPIVLQDHANRVPRIWRRGAWRRGLSVASGIAFHAIQQATPFVDSGLIARNTKVYAIPESTSRFMPGDQEEARRSTRMTGDPAILWVGHLNANKDPLTVLDGVSQATRALPRLQLYCCFGTAPLMRQVEERIGADPLLRGRVHLVGRVPHLTVELFMRSADLFVLGSHREGSGFSLLEALACGLQPVVTDIPSFRAITAEGTLGTLWQCGDADALCAALLRSAKHIGPQQRAAVRSHFDREFSADALGEKLAAMYRDLVSRNADMGLCQAEPTKRRALESA